MKSEILSLLPPGHPWGQHLHWLESVDSTNHYAKELARRGAPEGTIIIARAQTDGRGRMGRSFSSPAGQGLYFSLILRPNCPAQDLMHLTCAAGVAAANAVEQAAGIRPGIKWTNDLVWQKKKMGGILTELAFQPQSSLVDYAIIGIGINCRQARADFPPQLQDMACSIATVTGKGLSPAHLAACLVDALWDMNRRLLTQKSKLMESFCQDCITIGQNISIHQAGSIRYGTATGVDSQGGLQIRLADGSLETVTTGEVSIRGMYGYV